MSETVSVYTENAYFLLPYVSLEITGNSVTRLTDCVEWSHNRA